MSELFNRYLTNPQGRALLPEPVPLLRAEGAPLAPAQLGMARFVFERYLGRSRLSYVPNPVEQGFLPDGSRYRVGAVGGMRIMQVWPVVSVPEVESVETLPVFPGGLVFRLGDQFYVVDVKTDEEGDWYDHTPEWAAVAVDNSKFWNPDPDKLFWEITSSGSFVNDKLHVTDSNIKGLPHLYLGGRRYNSSRFNWRGLTIVGLNTSYTFLGTTYGDGEGCICIGSNRAKYRGRHNRITELLYDAYIVTAPFKEKLSFEATLEGRLHKSAQLDRSMEVKTPIGKYYAQAYHSPILRNGIHALLYDVTSVTVPSSQRDGGDGSVIIINPGGSLTHDDNGREYSILQPTETKVVIRPEIYDIVDNAVVEVLDYDTTLSVEAYPTHIAVASTPDVPPVYSTPPKGYGKFYTDFHFTDHERIWVAPVIPEGTPLTTKLGSLHMELDRESWLRGEFDSRDPMPIGIGLAGQLFTDVTYTHCEYTLHGRGRTFHKLNEHWYETDEWYPEDFPKSMRAFNPMFWGVLRQHVLQTPVTNVGYSEQEGVYTTRRELGSYSVITRKSEVSAYFDYDHLSSDGANFSMDGNAVEDWVEHYNYALDGITSKYNVAVNARHEFRDVIHYDHFLDLLIYHEIVYSHEYEGTSEFFRHDDPNPNRYYPRESWRRWAVEGLPDAQDIEVESCAICVMHKGAVVMTIPRPLPPPNFERGRAFEGFTWSHIEGADVGQHIYEVHVVPTHPEGPEYTNGSEVGGAAVYTRLFDLSAIYLPEAFVRFARSPSTGASIIDIVGYNVSIPENNDRGTAESVAVLFIDKNHVRRVDDVLTNLDLDGAEFQNYAI